MELKRVVSGKMLTTDIKTSTIDEGIGVGWIVFVGGEGEAVFFGAEKISAAFQKAFFCKVI